MAPNYSFSQLLRPVGQMLEALQIESLSLKVEDAGVSVRAQKRQERQPPAANISLHVTWQKAFLPDLLSIVQTTHFDVLLATHSPFIVGDRSDLMVPLSSGVEFPTNPVLPACGTKGRSCRTQ